MYNPNKTIYSGVSHATILLLAKYIFETTSAQNKNSQLGKLEWKLFFFGKKPQPIAILNGS